MASGLTMCVEAGVGEAAPFTHLQQYSVLVKLLSTMELGFLKFEMSHSKIDLF